MQVYKGMDIGTAKPSAGERALVRHHLIDLVGPSEDWDVARFVAAAREALADISARGKRALFVGGTGLYLHALIDGFSVPGVFPELRLELEAEPSTERLYSRLRELDPDAAALICPGNRRRIVRALEVTLGSGRRFSSYGPGVGAFPPTFWRLAGVWLPRQVVSARIERRFMAMMEAGLLDEVRDLAALPGKISRTARQALGYKELLAHFEQGVPVVQAVSEAVRRTRRFSRRQRMWWRRDPRVRWFGSPDDPARLLPALIANFR
jgi:tRNA dimethylallyltransferase